MDQGNLGRGLFLLASYFMNRQFCDVTYGLKNSLRMKTRLVFFSKLAVMLLTFVGMLAGAALLWNEFVILGFLAIGLIAAILLPFGNQPVAIVREENGEFWLKGCSREYLARFQQG